jgi:hypothetical protein
MITSFKESFDRPLTEKAGIISRMKARYDIKKLNYQHREPVIYSDTIHRKESSWLFQKHGHELVVFPSNRGEEKTYITPEGDLATFRDKSRVHHYYWGTLTSRTKIDDAQGFTEKK